MRIAMVCQFPPQRDGIAYYTGRLVSALVRKGHRPFVISYAGYSYGQSYAHGLLRKHNLLSYLHIPFVIRSKSFKAVLIEHEYLFYNYLFFPIMLLMFRMLGIRISIVMHTVAPFDRGFKRFFFRLLDSSILLFASHVFVHTSYAKQRLQRSSVFRRPVHVVPMPVPKQSATPLQKRIRPLFLCFGFAYPDKNFELAIAAVKGMDADLIVATSLNPKMPVGKEYLEKLRALAAKQENVTLIDRFLSDEERKKLFHECTALIFPYKFIEQSAVLGEAWAASRIPVCADLPAMREEIGTTGAGMLFRQNDAADLQRQLKKLSSAALRRKLTAAIRKTAAERAFDRLCEEFIRYQR